MSPPAGAHAGAPLQYPLLNVNFHRKGNKLNFIEDHIEQLKWSKI